MGIEVVAAIVEVDGLVMMEVAEAVQALTCPDIPMNLRWQTLARCPVSPQ